MAKEINLDKAFSIGEKIVTTRPVGEIPEGAKGKVKLSNGLGEWKRYWVRFSDESIIGHIDHDDLVRPKHLKAWQKNQEELAKAAEAKELEATEVESTTETKKSTGSGIESQIPADLLERSKAAKKRLLG